MIKPCGSGDKIEPCKPKPVEPEPEPEPVEPEPKPEPKPQCPQECQEQEKPEEPEDNKDQQESKEEAISNIINNTNYVNVFGQDIPELNEKAKSRHEHYTSEFNEKEVFFRGQLYEEAILKLKNGHFRINNTYQPDKEAAEIIIDFVETNIANKVITDGYIFSEVDKNTKYYYTIKYIAYCEAMEKLKNGEFNIAKSEDIVKAIEKFVNKKIIEYIKG